MSATRSMAIGWRREPSPRSMSRALRSPLAFGINARRQISGFYVDVSGTGTVFSWTRAASLTIDVPGAIRANALGINAPGQIVGFFTDAGGTVHGFVAE